MNFFDGCEPHPKLVRFIANNNGVDQEIVRKILSDALGVVKTSFGLWPSTEDLPISDRDLVIIVSRRPEETTQEFNNRREKTIRSISDQLP